jgi:acyl dehydratase
MTPADRVVEHLKPKLGREIAVGEWLEIGQERIAAFAEVTGDVQWIHVDPERARRESPYGAAVAHGYLTLSLLPFLTQGNSPEFFRENYPGMRMRVNYGLNRVRFPSPVRAGSRVRARTALQSAEAKGDFIEIVYLYTVEIEGEEKPACVAESVVRIY